MLLRAIPVVRQSSSTTVLGDGPVRILACLLALLLAQAAHALEIVDQRGHTISLAKPPERLVFMPIPAPSTFITIDGSDKRVVGMNAFSASAMREGTFGKMFPDFTRIKTNVVMGGGDASNFSPNVEAILSLRPDLVFQWANAGRDVISVLDRTGLPVLGMRAGTWDDFAAYVRIMGLVAGKEGRAEALLDRQLKARRNLEAALAGIPTSEQPRVLYFNRAVNLLRVSGQGSFNDFYIRLAGGRNAASDNPPVSTVTIEQVLTWDPQVILLGNFDASLPADLYDDPRWQSVDAVRNRRVYRMPLGGYRWDPPSQESSLTWLWLAGLIHPERLNINLRNEMRDWFGFLYNHQLTDSEIDQILFVKENRDSVGYDRYAKR